MAEPMGAICNEGCGEQFTFNKLKTKTIKRIDKIYFNCTHCNHEYTVYYANAETKKLQKDMRNLQRLITHLEDKATIDEMKAMLTEVNELEAKVADSMQGAKQEFLNSN